MLRKRRDKIQEVPQGDEAPAQTMVEYMVLTGVVVALVLVGFRTLIPRSRDLSGEFFNKATNVIYGEAPFDQTFKNNYP